MPVARDNCGTRDSEDEQFINVCLGPIVFDAVRAVHPTTPILILGGHSHIRDCRKGRLFACLLCLTHIPVQFDGRSIALESGRYMETVGK